VTSLIFVALLLANYVLEPLRTLTLVIFYETHG
jgi:hypothetical protein